MLVSVVVPAFNAAPYIAQCVGSLLAQTYRELQVVCVDDGSTDQTRATLESVRGCDPRVKVITQKNQGVGGARNTGINNSSGELIMFVDADDSVDPDYVETFVKSLSASSDLVVVGDEHVSHSDHDAIRRFIYQSIRDRTLNPPWEKLYRRSVLDEHHVRFRTDVSLGEDLIFNIEYALVSRAIQEAAISGYRVRETPGSLTRSYRHTKYHELMTVNDVARELIEAAYGSQFESLLNYRRIRALISCVKSDVNPSSPLKYTDAVQRATLWQREHPRLRVNRGDFRMRSTGWAFRLMGLGSMARLAWGAQRVRGLRSRR